MPKIFNAAKNVAQFNTVKPTLIEKNPGQQCLKCNPTGPTLPVMPFFQTLLRTICLCPRVSGDNGSTDRR